MKNIHIELGMHRGDCCIPNFQELVAKDENITIYGFEPFPQFTKSCKQIETNETLKGHFHFIDKAAWIKDEKREIYPSARPRVGNSLFKSKKNVKAEWGELIECIDFSQWLANNFKKEDHITLSMDIEGSEYDVLNKMIEDDTISFINKLTIEFHAKKIRDQRIQQLHSYILKYLRENPIEVEIIRARG